MSPLRPSLREAWQFERPRLLVAQMTLLDGNLSGAFVVSCIVSWLTAAAFVLIAEDLRAVWWALLTTAVSVGCLLVRKVLPPPDDVARVARYAQAVRVMAALLGCCRGAMAPWLMDAAHPESITLVLGMSAGMSSGGLAVFAPSWPVAMAYWVCSVLPVAITLLDLGGAVNVTLGLGVLIYLWAMTVFSYHTSRMALRSITLRFENEGLIQRLRDQTERAMAARQIAEDALDEAEEANRAKTVFLASASHDLRQPLHALTLTLATLGRTPLTPRQQQLLAHASASADAAGEMLHTLLDFAKIDAGVVRPAPQPFALQGTFDKLSREFTPLADAKGLGWRARPRGARPTPIRHWSRSCCATCCSMPCATPSAVACCWPPAARGPMWPSRSGTRASAYPRPSSPTCSRPSIRWTTPSGTGTKGWGWACRSSMGWREPWGRRSTCDRVRVGARCFA